MKQKNNDTSSLITKDRKHIKGYLHYKTILSHKAARDV